MFLRQPSAVSLRTLRKSKSGRDDPAATKTIKSPATKGSDVLALPPDTMKTLRSIGVDELCPYRNEFVVYRDQKDYWSATLTRQVSFAKMTLICFQLLEKNTADPTDRYMSYRRWGVAGGRMETSFSKFDDVIDARKHFANAFLSSTGNKWLGSLRDTLNVYQFHAEKFVLLSRTSAGIFGTPMESIAELKENQSVHNQDDFSEDVKPIRHEYHIYTGEGKRWVAVVRDPEHWHLLVLLERGENISPARSARLILVTQIASSAGVTEEPQYEFFTESLKEAQDQFSILYHQKSGRRWTVDLQDNVDISGIENPTMNTVGVESEYQWCDIVQSKTSWPACILQEKAQQTANSSENVSEKEFSLIKSLSLKDRRYESRRHNYNSNHQIGSNLRSLPLAEDCGVDVDLQFDGDRTMYHVVWHAPLTLKERKFYIIQLLQKNDRTEHILFVRTGKFGLEGSSASKVLPSLKAGKRSFEKKFEEKTQNSWLGSPGETMEKFVPHPDFFVLESNISHL